MNQLPIVIGVVFIVTFLIGAGLNIAMVGRSGAAGTVGYAGALLACMSVIGIVAAVTIWIIQDTDRSHTQVDRYRADATTHLDSTYGLRPLAVDRLEIPGQDNQTKYAVRMERGDELLSCLLNTRTGPASITAHCKPYRP